jgi:hypothetical protein
MPYQEWHPFPPEAIVEVKNCYHNHSKVGPANKFWWGYEEDFGSVSEGVITKARRLDKPKGLTK